jgi:hypothetical protein
MIRYLRPNRHFLPSTGCMPTGRVVTRYQLPLTEWSCPDSPLRQAMGDAAAGLVPEARELVEGAVAEGRFPDLATAVAAYRQAKSQELQAIGQQRTATMNVAIREAAPRWGLPEFGGSFMIGLGVLAAAGGLGYWLLAGRT